MKVRLDIDLISEELYNLLLEEFKKQFGDVGTFEEWELTANQFLN